MPLKKRLVEQEMSVPLDTSKVKAYTSDLSGFLVSSDFTKLLESQGEIANYNKRISDLQSSTTVFNKEFEERHNQITPYKLPIFGTNQDILLLGFYFSYTFLVLVSLTLLYKNTQSIQNTVYAFIMSIFVLLIITAMLIRIA